MKALWRTLAWLVAWSPVLLLAVVGSLYVVQCVQVLTSPGTNLSVPVKTEAGPLLLKAESYTIDPLEGVVKAFGVKLEDGSGNELARARSVFLHAPHFAELTKSSVRADLREAYTVIVREPDGRIPLFEYFKPPKEKGEPVPIYLTLAESEVKFIDRLGGINRVQRARIVKGSFESAGDPWLATLDVRLAEGGSAQLSARSPRPGSISVSGRADKLEAAGVWAHLLDLPESKGWAEARKVALTSLRASGPFELRWVDGKPVDLDAEVAFSARDLATPWWASRSQVEFEGRLTESGMAGTFAARDAAGTNANLKASLDWSAGFKLKGKGDAAVARLVSVDRRYRREIPAEVDAGGLRASGSLAFSQEAGFTFQGEVQAQRIAAFGERIADAQGTLVVAPERIALSLDRGAWEGTQLTGSLALDLRRRTLDGFARTGETQLAPIAKRYTKHPIGGFGVAEAILSGTFENPTVALRANGRSSVGTLVEGNRQLVSFDLAGRLRGTTLSIERMSLLGSPGIASVSGAIDLKSQALELKVSTTAVELQNWTDQAQALMTARVAVRGTVSKPIADGRVELFGGEFKGQSAPILVGDLDFRNDRVVVKNFAAVRGASKIEGELALNLRTGVLGGSLQGPGLQLSELVADGGASGRLIVEQFTLGGTLDDPSFDAVVHGEGLVLDQIGVDAVSGSINFEKGVATLSDGKLTVGEGTGTLSGTYDVAKERGTAVAKFEKLPLDRFVPLLPGDTLIDGTMAGEVSLTVLNGRLTAIASEGFVQNLTLNPTLIGSGFYMVRSDGDQWEGSFAVGQLERYIQGRNLVYNAESQTIQGRLEINAMPIRDLYFAARPSLVGKGTESNVPQGVLDVLDRSEGALDLSVRVAGDLTDPTIELSALALADLTYFGDPVGNLALAANREPGGLWTVQQAQWTDGPGNVKVSGTLDEDGAIALTGDITNLKPEKLARFEPRLGSISGTGAVSFEVEGMTESPEITASLDGAFFETEAAPGGALKVSIAPIRIREGELSAEGSFNYGGLSGVVEANAPFSYPFTIAEKEPLTARLRLPRRPIQDFAELLPGVDFKTTEGAMEAQVQVKGLLDDLAFSGAIKADLPSLAFRGAKTSLKKVDLDGRFEGDRFVLTAKADGSLKGSVSANATLSVPDLAGSLEQGASGFLANRLSGLISVSGFSLKETLGKGGTLDVEGDGQFALAGTLKEPLVQTRVPFAVRRAIIQMPSEFEEVVAGPPSAIQPRFNVGFVVGQSTSPARVKASTADFQLYGDGIISGTFADLVASSSLTLRDGSIRLPNARIQVEDGGKVRFAYLAGPAGSLRLDVDLDGRTSLSSVRFGGIVQRYDIAMQIRGNILDPESQLIVAQSDPPDLSQAQILNLLGQSQIFETLGSEFLGRGDERVIGSALASFALPVVFDPFTQQIARELGLEYLTLEYNAFEGPTITLAKEIGKGFVFQGRRQLSETVEDIILFDYRLTYRPKFGSRSLRNVIFSFGADQDRPWKIAIEYGIRF